MTAPVLFNEQPCGAGKKIAFAQLNAEKSLNALSLPMVELLLPQLKAWNEDDSVLAVFLHGEGEKAFCAGGDVVALYKGSAAYGEELPDNSCEQFFTEEYQLDYLIHTYNKPFIVWGTGIVMGGGLGLLAGASHRIVTETTRMAMPEITLGLYPDVGGTWFLNRCPEKTGLFLGLSGANINAADAKFIGLADYFVTQDLKAVLLERLSEVQSAEDITVCVQALAAQSAAQEPEHNVEQHLPWINQACASDDLLEVIATITAYAGEDKWLSRAASTLACGCPLTPFLVWEQLQRGKNLSLQEVFQQELIMSVNCARLGHFKEGVRALLIDKDRRPQWRPASFEAVTAEQVAAHFNTAGIAPWQPLN